MRYFLVFLFLFSCGEVKHAKKEPERVDEKWVCYHPGTEYHNNECIEEIYPNGCYVRGDDTKFCWILSRQECLESMDDSQLTKICESLGFK